MNLTSRTRFSDLLSAEDGSSADTQKTAETTKWSQKQLSDCRDCGDQSSPAEEWAYLAQGRVVTLTEQPRLNSQQPPYCFCDHSGLLVDFSNLEALDLAALRVEMDAIAHSLGEAYRRMVLGTANKLLWHWADCIGAIGRGEQGGLVVDKAIARKMATAKTLLKCALTDLRDYLAEWWELNVPRTTLTRWVKEALDGLGVVQWFGAVADGKKPRHWAINVPALLLLAEACERRILNDAKMAGASHGEEMAALPEHQGYSLKLLFDAVFPGFGWNREGGPEETPPLTYAETDQYQAMRPAPALRRSQAAIAQAEPAEPDERRSVLLRLRDAVKVTGWTEAIAQECDRLAGRWGPSWGIEAVYERIVTRWDCWA
jgi:hypothetical protein